MTTALTLLFLLGSNQTVVMILSPKPESVDARFRAMAKRIEREAAKRWKLIPSSKMVTHLGLVGARESMVKLEKGYTNAKNLVYGFRRQEAIQELENLLVQARKHKNPALEKKILLLLAKAHLDIKNQEKAVATLQEALKIDTNLILSEREYPPHLLKLLITAKSQMGDLAKYRLTIEARPAGAKLFFEGKEVKSPFRDKLWAGTYHVRLQDSQTDLERLIVLDRNKKITFDLTLDCFYAGVYPTITREYITQSFWRETGQRLGVDRLITLEKPQGRYWRTNLVDLKKGYETESAWIETDAKNAAKKLVIYLSRGKADGVSTGPLPMGPEAYQ